MAESISAKTAWALAKAIKGGSKRKGPTSGTATVVRVDQDGTHWVRISGSDVETPVNGAITVDAKAGDTVQYHLEDTRISITGNATSPSVGRDYVGGEVSVVTKQVEAVRASIVETNELVAAKATIGQLEAERARIGELEADHVSVSDFQAEQASIDSLQAATADIDTIRANSAKVQNLTAAQLEADHAKVGQLDVSQIAADHATIGTLDTTYMHADMANADVAWVENGTIKDGAIVSAMINDVSANKLTAGTINGSVINVTNLNADNITAGTINGQRIGEGSLSLDKLSEDVYTEAEVDSIVDGLNDRIDGAIETHTGTTVPTLNNAPASSWNTTALRDEHVGDVYYVVNSQSQQNGYCYRFTKSGSTYSWQLIKDSDVTAALSRLTTAEGKITTFDSDISKLKTDTGTLTTKTESLETRMSDAESDILDKVDTTTFNEVSDTVDQHSQTISQHTTAISNKADNSTVTAVTNRVSKNEQDISGINTTIGELQDTVETKADGSTVETVSNRLNTVSNTVDGHTQTLTSVQNTLSSKADSSTVSTLTTKVNNVSDTVDGHTSQLSSITTTQTTMQTTLDKTVKSSIQLWFSKANTTAPSKPTSQVTSTSTSGNAWRIVVPAYNSSYPHYYYCWQYEYTDGTYGWSAVVRDIAMGESQSTARTADSNASAAVTTANTASTNASTALTTANTANTNATDAKTTATTASTTASEAKTTAETAASDASTAKTNAASAVSTANSASTTATNAQTTANANIKSSVQLWFTKANSTAPNKPTSVVSTSNANTANAWNLVVPVWNKNYPHYFYCYQQQKGDGNYQWTDVVYDRATSEAQQLANTTSTSLSTLQEDYATYKQTTTENVSSIGTRLTTAEGKISTAESNISQNANNIALKVSESDVTGNYIVGKINLNSTTASIAAQHINLQGAVTISDLSSDAQSATLNSNMSVGGRNLLYNTGDWSSWACTPKATVSDEVLTTANTDTSAFQRANGWFTLDKADIVDRVITVSFEAKKTDATALSTLVFQLFTTSAAPKSVTSGNIPEGTRYFVNLSVSSSSKVTIENATAINATTWTKVTITFKPSEVFNTSYTEYAYLAMYVGISNKVGSAQYRRLKAEFGNTATDWTPAPEDVDSAISDAAKTATSYVTDINSNGITVHPSRSDYATNGGRAVINGDGLTVYLGSDDVASYGASARIGKANSDRVTVDSTNGITVYKGNSKRLQTTANGIDVYGSDGATSVASFGATARVGTANALHVNVGTVIGDDRAVSISDIDGNSFVDVVVHNVGLGNGTESPSMEINVPDSSDSVLWLHKMVSDDGESFLNKYEAELCLGRFVVYKTDQSTGQQTAIVETTDTELNTEVNFVCEGDITCDGDITGWGDITCSGNAMFSGKTWTVGLESSSQIIGTYQLVAEGTQNSIALRANTVGHRGLYDVTNDEWILYRDGSNDNLVIKFLSSNFDIDAAVALSGSTSISANGVQTGTTNITKSGWVPVAIAGVNVNSHWAATVRWYLSARSSGTGTISWAVHNMSGSAAITPTVTFYVLWARGN